MNGSHWTFKVSGILLALIVSVLAASPAAAEKKDPNRAPTFRERIDAAREGCKASKGTFTMSIEVSQGRAHTNCAETDGTNTSCTISMSSSICENKPAENSTRPVWGHPIGDIQIIGAEDVTAADGQTAPPDGPLPAITQGSTIQTIEVDEWATLQPAEAEPVEPAETAPAILDEREDEDA
jgi:hypothetical protein